MHIHTAGQQHAAQPQAQRPRAVGDPRQRDAPPGQNIYVYIYIIYYRIYIYILQYYAYILNYMVRIYIYI